MLNFQKAGFAEIPAVLIENILFQDALNFAEVAFVEYALGFRRGTIESWIHGTPLSEFALIVRELNGRLLNICNDCQNLSLQ